MGIAVTLLLSVPHMVSGSPPRCTRDAWQRLRAASAVPGVALGLSMFVVAVQNISRTRRRHLGEWALCQVEGPSFELYAGPIAVLFILGGVLLRRPVVTLGTGTWLFGVVLFSGLIVLYYGIQQIRRGRHWNRLAGHTVCANCGYVVDGLEVTRCPECGRHLAACGEAAPFGRNILLR